VNLPRAVVHVVSENCTNLSGRRNLTISAGNPGLPGGTLGVEYPFAAA